MASTAPPNQPPNNNNNNNNNNGNNDGDNGDGNAKKRPLEDAGEDRLKPAKAGLVSLLLFRARNSANLFDDPDFNDYKLFVTVEGETSAPRVINVTKLMLAKASPIFLERIRANKEGLQLVLPRGTQMVHFVDLIRWVYAKVFLTPQEELLSLVQLAQEFQLDGALEAAVAELTGDMTVPKAASLLLATASATERQRAHNEPEHAQPRAPSNLDSLLETAQKFLVKAFADLESVDLSPRGAWVTLPVEAIRCILASSFLHVGCENVAFAAYRAWIHFDFPTRRSLATSLLPLIRFPLLHRNYLMDVVRYEADLDYPDEVKKLFAKRLIECYIYHTGTDPRREALGEPRPEPRRYDAALLTVKHTFTINNVSQEREMWSDTFSVGGYTFALLYQRKNIEAADGGTIGVYMHIKPKESGLSYKFFLPLAFELTVKTRGQAKFISPKGVYASPFSHTNRAWGYVDLLNLRWAEFIRPTSQFRESNDSLVIKAHVGITETPAQTSGPQSMPPPPPVIVQVPANPGAAQRIPPPPTVRRE